MRGRPILKRIQIDPDKFRRLAAIHNLKICDIARLCNISPRLIQYYYKNGWPVNRTTALCQIFFMEENEMISSISVDSID